MYLITGGAGFIGSNIAEILLNKGNKVRILDDFSSGKKENISHLTKFKDYFEVLEGTICDRDVCKKAVKDVKFISHQAAIPSVPKSVDKPIETNLANVNGTLNILEAARNSDTLQKIIFAGSSSVYGNSKENIKIETLTPSPLSPYAAQKLMGEHYFMIYNSLFDLPTIGFRYFNVFGPRQDTNSPYSAVIPLFIKALINKKSPVIYGDGNQSRDFTYVDNIAEAHILAFNSNVQGEVMNIACGEQTSLNALLNELNSIFNSDISAIHKEERKGDVKHSLAGIEKSKNLIHFSPKTSVFEGLEKTVKWYQDNVKA